MEQEKIARINALARKAKAEGLTPEELQERDVLRKEYIAAFRKNLTSQLEAITVVESDGTRHKVQKQNSSSEPTGGHTG